MAARENVIVEIVDSTDKYAGSGEYVANGFRAVAGIRTFRQYDWMTDSVRTNVAGNLRGMVVSARWRTVYTVTSRTADVVGTVATVASIAGNAIDMAPQFEAVYRSDDTALVKAGKYSGLVSSVAQRTLAGIVTGGVHLLYLPLIEGCGMLANAGLHARATNVADSCSRTVRNADSLLQSSTRYVTDPVNQQRVLQTVIDFVIP